MYVPERIRIHEAGHAIAGRAAGIPIVRVFVRPDRGVTTFGGGYDALWLASERMRRPTAIRHMIRTTMAGAEAEGLMLGNISGGDIDDLQAIERLLEALRAARSDISARTMREQTRAILGQRRRQIRRVADALAERPLLTGADIAALLARRRPP